MRHGVALHLDGSDKAGVLREHNRRIGSGHDNLKCDHFDPRSHRRSYNLVRALMLEAAWTHSVPLDRPQFQRYRRHAAAVDAALRARHLCLQAWP